MKIVVLGAGTVGTSIADLLCHHRHSVSVVDSNKEHIGRINEELDVRVVHGSASKSSVLFQAGVIGADLCLAVTGCDEVNLVGASLAKAMGTHRAVARVYSSVFRDLSTFDYQRHFKIDRLLSLEHLSAIALARGIRAPGSLTLEHFARGELEMQELALEAGAKALGLRLNDLDMPKGVRVGSIRRNGVWSIAGADVRLEVGDRVTVIGTSEEIDDVKETFQPTQLPRRNVVIAGGGETGYHLALVLENGRFNVLVMEADRQRCELLSSRLKHTTVVHSDATRRSSLEEERVGRADVFVACTGDDEDNIMAGVEARELGTNTIMAVINRPDYANVVGKLGIDHAVSPRQVISRQVLGLLATGPVISHTHLGGEGIGVLEIEVAEGVPVTEHVLANLSLPAKCLIAAVMHDDYVRVPGADDRLKAGDTVVALVEDSVVEDTLKMFGSNGRRS